MTEFPKAVSVVMRCKDEGWAVGGTLRQLFNQTFDGEIELIVIDSGSTDGSLETLAAANPAKLIQIKPSEYVPGVVMNRGAAEASHDWIIYLNADAEPVGTDWLKELLTTAIETPNFGAAFSRQIARPDCQAVFAHGLEQCFGPQRESANWEHFFSMVSSITHRSVLDAHPFREDLQYAEDDEWTRRLIENGYQIPFSEKSVVMHSHNYTLQQSYKRAFGDAKAMAATAEKPPENALTRWLAIGLGWANDTRKDLKWCAANHRLTEMPHAAAVRFYQRLGRNDGYRAGWKHYQRDT
ncbi:glycosyltransferase [Luteolibacter pohnpeiensis]|uniref:Glycosyltransferase n=1 Tax=Luteolibacter pohnpeiensis TaxID=454153 RepID=A0A934S4L1_9BACT|nr:glycosyltransferase [Luteolibacter pohnpeiensis]MBK1882431.1 glycosyltransferase [Luteolibacter pohnpeiensis]